MFTLLIESSVQALRVDDTVISLNELRNFLRIANNIGTLDNAMDRALERLRRAGAKALETMFDSPTLEKLACYSARSLTFFEIAISLVGVASTVIDMVPSQPLSESETRRLDTQFSILYSSRRV